MEEAAETVAATTMVAMAATTTSVTTAFAAAPDGADRDFLFHRPRHQARASDLLLDGHAVGHLACGFEGDLPGLVNRVFFFPGFWLALVAGQLDGFLPRNRLADPDLDFLRHRLDFS